MSKLLKAAVVGCGRMGANTRQELEDSMPKGWLPHNHAAALSAIDGVKLTSLSDISKDALNAASKRYGVKSVYTDYQVMLAQEEIDVLTIATRANVRTEIIENAVKYGVRGIHAEKPLTQSIKQTKHVAKLLEVNQVSFTYGVYRRYIEVYQRAKEICDSGELGDLLEITVSFGKTKLLWNLPHAADLLLYFSGTKKINWATGVVKFSPNSKIKDFYIDDDPVVETATIMFENEVIGTISAAGGLSVKLSLTKGEITVGADGSWLEVSRPNNHLRSPYFYNRQSIISQPLTSAMQITLEDLRDQVTLKKPPSLTLSEIIESQRLLYSIVLSELHGGARFFAQDVPDDLVITGRLGSLYA